ncbi:dihydrolipoyl dehydrogenase [Acuticoccus kandeliae]|uniref:dihydrolipoyl dehydrogenase n=1 Tax=Acuticoccus kandeliae TaxID=2073160 RepID=UPI000D3E0521|nr:dihydrolipoyl dehydrogenase [Acuticoccus kandeliae]
MADRSVAVAVIGAGTAGLAALRAARRETDNVLLIEHGPFGTTCARVGCMPSKLLIAAANQAEAIRRAPEFGIGVDAWSVDGTRVMRRLHALRDHFVGHVLESVDAIPERLKLIGRARFDGDQRLCVETHAGEIMVDAERVVIATGSRATVPPEFSGLDSARISDDVFTWSDLPSSLTIVGAGVIGLEIGQALARLGVRVKVLTKGGHIGPLTDPDLAEHARAIFETAFDLVADYQLTEISDTPESVTIDYRAQGRDFSVTAERVLLTLGRAPNVDGLALETTSLALDGDGVPDFDRETGRCGESSIYIAGDVMDEAPLLHEASDTGTIAGLNAARHPLAMAARRKVPMTIVFSAPQTALVGETHRALTDRGARFVTGAVDFADQGRAIVMGEGLGRLHLYAEAETGRILGAEMLAPEAEHLAHILALAIDRDARLEEMMDLPFYHPTVEEGLRTAICDALAKLGQRDCLLPHGLSFSAGA